MNVFIDHTAISTKYDYIGHREKDQFLHSINSISNRKHGARVCP